MRFRPIALTPPSSSPPDRAFGKGLHGAAGAFLDDVTGFETLRWQAPIVNLPLRYAVEDIDIDGVTIHRGEAILAVYGAAGRDSAVFGEDAEQFDVIRTVTRRNTDAQ